MKAKHFIFPMLAGFLCACSNDFLPEFDDTCEWNTSLEELVTDNAGLFASRNIEITGSRLLKDVKPDSTLFFGEDYGYFPVYSKKDSVFEVIRYEDSMKSDGSTLNINAATERIRSLIERADDYNVIELTWRYGNESFKSLALFDKRTGELEYDNMLFNMETISKYDTGQFQMMLRGTENQNSENGNYSGSERVTYSVDNIVVASAQARWNAWGHWTPRTAILDEDDDYVYYVTYYTYNCDSLHITATGSHTDDSDCFYISSQNSIVGEPRYEFEYIIWAGSIGGLEGNFALQRLGDDNFQRKIHSGEGHYRLVQGPASRLPKYTSVNKHNGSVIEW